MEIELRWINKYWANSDGAASMARVFRGSLSAGRTSTKRTGPGGRVMYQQQVLLFLVNAGISIILKSAVPFVAVVRSNIWSCQNYILAAVIGVATAEHSSLALVLPRLSIYGTFDSGAHVPRIVLLKLLQVMILRLQPETFRSSCTANFR